MSTQSITLPTSSYTLFTQLSEKTSCRKPLMNSVEATSTVINAAQCRNICCKPPLKIHVKLGVDPTLEAIRAEHFSKVPREERLPSGATPAQQYGTYSHEKKAMDSGTTSSGINAVNGRDICSKRPLRINVELGVDPRLEVIKVENFFQVNREEGLRIDVIQAQLIGTYSATSFFEFGDRKNLGVPYQALDGKWYACQGAEKPLFRLSLGEIYEFGGKKYQIDEFGILFEQHRLGHWCGCKDKRRYVILQNGDKFREGSDGQSQRLLKNGQWFKTTKNGDLYRQLWNFTWQIQEEGNHWATCREPSDD